MLKLENVTVKYNNFIALNSINLQIKEGEIFTLLGPSGCGKTTLLRAIAGYEKILNGKLIISNKDMTKVEPDARSIGIIFQNYALFPHMTVCENIKLGLKNMDRNNKELICNKYIKDFNLENVKNNYPKQLSGGQQQRVALARALAKNPDILLLDEPFSALDYHLRDEMEKNLRNTLEKYKGNTIFVTHNINEAYRVCEDIVIYDDGNGTTKRNKDELFNEPKSLKEAKLTGFKNISRFKYLDNELIYALDWDLNISIDNAKKYKNFKYLAIREDGIKISNNRRSDGIYMEIINITENPFDFTIGIKKEKFYDTSIIYMNVKKEDINVLRSNYLRVNLDKDKICFF